MIGVCVVGDSPDYKQIHLYDGAWAFLPFVSELLWFLKSSGFWCSVQKKFRCD